MREQLVGQASLETPQHRIWLRPANVDKVNMFHKDLKHVAKKEYIIIAALSCSLHLSLLARAQPS